MNSASLTRRSALMGSAASAALLFTIPTAKALPQAAAATVPRLVLALYDGAIETHLKETSVHGLAAMPLEWLGLTLEYHDVRNGLPPLWTDPAYRAVLTWFPEPNLADYAGYAAWIERVAAAGIKIVQIGDAAPKPGTMTPAAEAALRRRVFATCGVRTLGLWSAVTLGDQISYRDEASTEFEIRFDAGLPAYELYAPSRPDTASWLVVTRADQVQSRSHLIMVSPAGGFIAPGYATGIDPETGVKQWFVDPFAFFTAALALDDLPAADTTTLCGRRIYYSHIDGDGWRSISQVRSLGRAPGTNAEIVLQSVIAANPDLPVTVAPIAAEMDPAFAGDLRAIGAARALFKLAHVEAATHTYTHPFRWDFFKNYAPDAEKPYQEVYRSAVNGHVSVVETSGNPASAPACCGRASRNPSSPPRAFGGRPFDLNQEVTGAAKLIEAVAASANKRVRLLQWPGDCSPFPAALRCVADAGLLNINGGDTRCDKDYPSVSAVAPLGFRRDGLTQIYASNSSEELYTDLWTDKYFGFRDLPETWDRTGAPRRLKPINLYYHMYSGERRASLDALLGNIASLRTRGDFIGIHASHFAAIAGGFFSLDLHRISTATWRVRNRGSLQTLRFAHGDRRMLDLAVSTGVLGERVINGHLYVALDPASPDPLVALVQRVDAPPSRPVLVQSSWTVSGLSIDGDHLAFKAEGFGPGSMEWRVPSEGQWNTRALGQDIAQTVGPDGLLRVDLSPLPTGPADITITRVTL